MYPSDLATALNITMSDREEIDILKEGGFGVMSALLGNPTTTRQLAVRLGLNRARVQFILDRFIEHGYIYIYHETNEAGLREQYYALANSDIMFMVSDRHAVENRLAVIQLISDSLRTNVARVDNTEVQDAVLMLKLAHCKMRPAKAREFLQRLQELADLFNESEEDDAEECFGLALGIYPMVDEQ